MSRLSVKLRRLGLAILSLGTLTGVVLLCCHAGAAEPAATPAQGEKGTLTSMSEPPHWPWGFETPKVTMKPDKTGKATAPLLAWVPPGAKRIRAIFIVPNNSDSKHVAEHSKVREVAAKQQMAILYLRNGDEPDVQEILDFMAEKSGIAEFRHAPWIPFGKSSRGRFPIAMAWHNPQRTIASISYHAETPTWPVGPDGKLNGETILHVNLNGESEWGGTWFVHVRPSLLNYRLYKNWLPHQAIARGVGHGDYPESTAVKDNPAGVGDRMPRERIWDYAGTFIDKAIELRVPKDEYATNGPVKLKQVDDSTGYVIDPFAIEDLYRVAHFPLVWSGKEYEVAKQVENPGIFAAIPPAKDYTPPDGVPVAAPVVGKSQPNWLIADVKFGMKRDPMSDLGGFEMLRPQPGDRINIDGTEATFRAAKPGQNGGMNLGGLKKWGQDLTVVGYTVLDVPETMRVRLSAQFSVAGRLQMVLNGTPIEHQQIVELQKGKYPLLMVLRLNSVNWGAVAPTLLAVTDDEVKLAQAHTIERMRYDAETKRRLTELATASTAKLVRKASDVPPEERKKMFWVADREQAEAWFRLHAIHGQRFESP